jgi:FlgD Ig-like domain
MNKFYTILSLMFFPIVFSGLISAQQIFSDDFESGAASPEWGVYYAGEDELAAVPMASVPLPLANGGDYVGWLEDVDTSYTGVALALAGSTEAANYSIEGDVYCYVNHPDGSAYTGLAVYSDSSIGTYIKMAADFDPVPYPRIRLFNNHLDPITFTYTFNHSFVASDIPGGIPTQNGWHKMKVEVKTINADTTAFWCYFDDQLLAGCPVYDTGDDRISSGQFGVYAFQNGFPLPGYFDNISVNPLVTSVEEDDTDLADGYYLEQNYPNPFNPETKIAYQLASSGFASIIIYDLLGREIKTLVSKEHPAGSYTVTWNGADELGNSVPSGVYLYSLKTGNFIESKKMILMK